MKFYKETNFKETEIGKIPSEWKVNKLEQLVSFRNGQRPKLSESGTIPIFGANGIMGFTNEFLIENDFTLIVGRVGASGQIHLGRGKIWVSDNAIYTERYDREKIYLPFLYYLLIHKKLDQYASKTTHPLITQTFLNNFIISLPPIIEQRAIAEVLSVVDLAIQKTDEIIAKTERLKKGLMQTLLTRGIGHKEFKETPIGRIPKTWQIVRLKEIAKGFISGGTPSTKNPKYWNGDIPWIRSIHLSKYYIDESVVEQYITREGLENSASNIVPKGNLIVATRVGIGKAAVNLIDVAINQDLTGILIDKNKVDPFFVVWYLLSPKIVNMLESFARGTTIKGVAQDHIKELLLPLPPLNEQHEIATILSKMEKKIEIRKRERTRLERIKRGLMDLLLTGRIRVKVS